MATRLYLPSTTAAPDISPAFSSDWEDTTPAVRRITTTALTSSAFTNKAYLDPSSADHDSLLVQFVSPAFAATTITNPTVSCSIRGSENTSGNDLFLALHVRVVKPDGTLRGTILSLTRDDNELVAASARSRYLTATPTVSISASTGDRLVIEIGFGGDPTSGTVQGTLRFGDSSGSDLPAADDSTSDFNPWVELSTDLTFSGDFRKAQISWAEFQVPDVPAGTPVPGNWRRVLTVGDADASDLTYTPSTLTDWDSDTDPGGVDDALDQLAERVDDNEEALASTTLTTADIEVDDYPDGTPGVYGGIEDDLAVLLFEDENEIVWYFSTTEEGGFALYNALEPDDPAFEVDEDGNILSISRVRVENDGVYVGGRRTLNFIAGSNITLTIADAPGQERINVTIAASGGAGHNSVTLDTNADTLLSLSTQELGLDTQVANRVLAGPTSGGDAVPTFRALVDADIPSAIARDSEVTAAVDAHEADPDPHSDYALDSDLTTHEGAADPHPGYLTPTEHTAIGDSSPHHAEEHTHGEDELVGGLEGQALITTDNASTASWEYLQSLRGYLQAIEEMDEEAIDYPSVRAGMVDDEGALILEDRKGSLWVFKTDTEEESLSLYRPDLDDDPLLTINEEGVLSLYNDIVMQPGRTIRGLHADRTIILNGGAGVPSTTSPCTGPTQNESSSNDVNYFTLDFPDGSTTVGSWTSIRIPDNYRGGQPLRVQFVWTSTSTGVAYWQFQAQAQRSGTTIDSSWPTALQVRDTLPTASTWRYSAIYQHLPSGNPKPGDLFFFRVIRIGGDASDTLEATASLLLVNVEYPTEEYSD